VFGGGQLLPRFHRPHPETDATVSRSQPLSIGAEGDRLGVVESSKWWPDWLPGSRIPDLESVVLACRYQQGAIRTESNAGNSPLLPGQIKSLLQN
jgi:hypothetical protein